MGGRVDDFRQTLDSSKAPGFLYVVLGLVALLLVTDGFGTQAMGFVAPVIGKAWALKKGAIAGAITMGLVGVMIGACGVTPLADRIGGRRILIACALAAVLALALKMPLPLLVMTLLVTALVFERHKANIRRLLAGQEPRIGKSHRPG